MPTQNQRDTITGYLQGDHRRLDSLMLRCKELVEAGELKAASGIYDEFRAGLLRHIRIEEEILFPEFEEATGMSRSGGPTGVMHSEHLEIMRLLEEIGGLFDDLPPALGEFEPLRSALVALLSEHNAKEERILYPMTDLMVPPQRLAEIVRKAKSS